MGVQRGDPKSLKRLDKLRTELPSVNSCGTTGNGWEYSMVYDLWAETLRFFQRFDILSNRWLFSAHLLAAAILVFNK